MPVLRRSASGSHRPLVRLHACELVVDLTPAAGEGGVVAAELDLVAPAEGGGERTGQLALAHQRGPPCPPRPGRSRRRWRPGSATPPCAAGRTASAWSSPPWAGVSSVGGAKSVVAISASSDSSSRTSLVGPPPPAKAASATPPVPTRSRPERRTSDEVVERAAEAGGGGGDGGQQQADARDRAAPSPAAAGRWAWRRAPRPARRGRSRPRRGRGPPPRSRGGRARPRAARSRRSRPSVPDVAGRVLELPRRDDVDLGPLDGRPSTSCRPRPTPACRRRRAARRAGARSRGGSGGDR